MILLDEVLGLLRAHLEVSRGRKASQVRCADLGKARRVSHHPLFHQPLAPFPKITKKMDVSYGTVES